MPEGRFLSKSVALDLVLNDVSVEADYLFMRMIPHVDREGRLFGHPEQVKSIAVPLRPEFTALTIEKCLKELAAAKLIRWYEVDGRQYIAFPGFEKNQKGMRKDREAESRLPSPQSGGVVDVMGVLRTAS